MSCKNNGEDLQMTIAVQCPVKQQYTCCFPSWAASKGEGQLFDMSGKNKRSRTVHGKFTELKQMQSCTL